jgi:hypothetical protein
MNVIELRPHDVFLLGKKRVSINDNDNNNKIREQRYGFIPASRLKSKDIPSIPNLINATSRLHFDYDPGDGKDKHFDTMSYTKGDDDDDKSSSHDTLKNELNALDLGTAQLQRIITQMNELMVKSSKDNFYFNKNAPAAAGLNHYIPYLHGNGLLPKKGESVEHILLEKMKLEEAAKRKAEKNK